MNISVAQWLLSLLAQDLMPCKSNKMMSCRYLQTLVTRRWKFLLQSWSRANEWLMSEVTMEVESIKKLSRAGVDG